MALRGIRVLELSGLAPGPFCGMLLADCGAEVIRVDKPYASGADAVDTKLGRGKKSIAVDLKNQQGRQIISLLSNQSDIFLDPYRAGVMERLELGPSVLMKKNPKLIYARLSGYGQNGPLSKHAGHDINYLAYSGVLWALGHPKSNPQPPINLLADFAGGGLLCAYAIMAALFERATTTTGKLLDINMTEGAAYISSFLWRTRQSLPMLWTGPPGTNLLDGGKAFYQTYETKDGRHVAVGALEPQFFKKMLVAIGADFSKFDQFGDQAVLRSQLAKIFSSKTFAEWSVIAQAHPDACLAPVLDLEEAAKLEHARERKSFIRQPKDIGGLLEPRPVPTGIMDEQMQGKVSPLDPHVGEFSCDVLRLLGYPDDAIVRLAEEKVIECPPRAVKETKARMSSKL